MSNLSVKERVTRQLRRAGGSLTAKEMTARLSDVPYSTVRQEMQQMAKDGLLERPDRGYYSLSPQIFHHIRIERIERLEKAGLDEDALRLILEDLVDRHPAIFWFNEGYYSRVPIRQGFFAHLSIFGSTLVCMLVYERPRSECTQAWEDVFLAHLELLNSRTRRGDLSLLNEDVYKLYFSKIEDQRKKVEEFAKRYDLYEGVRHLFEQVDYAHRQASLEIEFSDAALSRTEFVLIALHLILLETVDCISTD